MNKSNCGVTPGQRIALTFRLDARMEPDEQTIRKVMVTVEDLYTHHIRVRMPAGYCACFRYWEFARIRRGE